MILSSWLMSTDRSNSYRANGAELTTNTDNAFTATDRLAINTGFAVAAWAEASDFAIQSVLVYNYRLSDLEVESVKNWLISDDC